MTIETGPKAGPAPKSSGAGEARAAKSRSNPDAQNADAEGQGFMAILSSVSDAATDTPTEASADAASVVSAATDPLATPAVDPALLLAQGQKNPDAESRSDAEPAAWAVGGAGKPTPGTQSDTALAAESAPGGAQESRTKGLQRMLGQARSDKTAAASDAQPAATAQANAPAQHDFKLFAAMEAQRNLQTTKAPEPLLAVLGAKAEKPQGERSLFANAASENTYAGASSGPGAIEYSSSAAADVAPVLETQVAEQVKYWISADVQNAELKLDGLGEKPVEVSISISGNEAHVAFRSDELQTRGVLEGAGAHLKDMMQREGVVLTGVSVGTSGSQDGKGDDRSRPRAAMRIGQVTAAQTAPQGVPRRPAGATGRSVDLFV